MKRVLNYLWPRWVVFGFAALLLVVLGNYIFIQRYSSDVITIGEATGSHASVAIVFGGGVDTTTRSPRPLLQDRLDTGLELINQGIVDSLLLSGDNRELNYNEPQIMAEYLLEQGLSQDQLVLDFAGRSTYETCERASKVFGLERAYLISESTHLPRALFLCDHFGVAGVGVQSNGQSASGLQVGQRWRELLARNKAVFNAYIIGERTVLGPEILIENSGQ